MKSGIGRLRASSLKNFGVSKSMGEGISESMKMLMGKAKRIPSNLLQVKKFGNTLRLGILW